MSTDLCDYSQRLSKEPFENIVLSLSLSRALKFNQKLLLK